MTQYTKILLPKLGESILSATIVQWYKKPGDTIIKDEPLLEVNTDKVASEIPSPVSGILIEIHVNEGVELQVGELLASISTGSELISTKKQPEIVPKSNLSDESNPFLTPAVLRLIQEKKILLSNIDKIPHTGQGGRLTKQDVENYCPLQSSGPISPDVERIKMSPLRKAIADNMVKSFYEAPHASLVTEVDVTDVMKLIAREKSSFHNEHGVKLTITSFVAQAIVRAVGAYPLLNASIEGDTILQKKSINLGLAVGVEQGVMVPVIRGCQYLNLPQLAKAIGILGDKARNQKLIAHDVQEGTITLTNFGMTGISIGIPIIRHPEVAIIGLGAMVRKAVPMPDDSIAIRSVMMVSLTFDHRVVDGLYGCGFLGEIKKNLEHLKLAL
jgi:2-oxoglutarate dehydrogenase E2 component (dihydrolipoamide succinyltransferase)